eukprot:CAMPEP_0172322576 /NCGR_PEP_ID=MMETSP1058-20130122/46274_1 /TAXON_ID=83371 /ORGANISM="Detonula confervacea, Strain CCMP 353" /LENGTH=217 /DNA_ID=CAMNT_0013038349 /DNA_START=48 /DNA_END=701 /DNA_ORIENTATION=-
MMFKQIAFILALASSASAIELSPDNFEAETAGKSVFLKFFAPWCGHCKKLKPDWDKLMEEFGSSATQLVGDVDCTAGGKPLCDENGVKGYPTLKWGDPSDLQDYQGGRTFDDLKKFVEENLKPLCSVKNMDLCDDEKKSQIEKYLGMAKGDLEAAVAAEEKKIADAEETFKTEVAALQERYSKLSEEKEAAAAEVKAAGLGLMKSVLKHEPEVKDEL